MFKYNIDIYLDKGNGLVCNKKKKMFIEYFGIM